MTTTQISTPLQRGGGGGTTTPKEETTTTSSLKQHHNRQRRTLVIKSFKTAPKIPPRFLDRAWSERLRVALRAIHDQEPCEESHERIYRLVEDLVVGNFGAELYEKVKRAIEDRYVCFWVPFSYRCVVVYVVVVIVVVCGAFKGRGNVSLQNCFVVRTP